MAYTGAEPFPGLSPEQIKKIEDACACADPTWHDGIWRDVYARLSEGLEEEPARDWDEGKIDSAISEALEAMGVDPEAKAKAEAPVEEDAEADAEDDDDNDDTPDGDGDPVEATPRRRRAKSRK